MSYDSTEIIKFAIKEASAGPVVSAAPGYYLLHEHDPERAPEPILAWRIGGEMVLPVIAVGCEAGLHYILHPDGIVRPHFRGCDYNLKTFKSFAEWHDHVTGQNEPPKKKKKKLKAAKMDTDGIPDFL